MCIFSFALSRIHRFMPFFPVLIIIVLKVGSELESHTKTMQSLPSSNSVVETKWFRSLVQGWIVTVKQLKLCLQMFLTLPLQL